MRVARLQVEEGFLDGLDLTFASGLNVIIGERGTGKTSIIELIRFALGVENLVPSAAEASQRHAIAVLGSGRVIVSLAPTANGEEELTFVRSASDSSAQHSGTSGMPLILSQTEIENLGLQPAGRLKLIDGIDSIKPRAEEEQLHLTTIRSITREVEAQQAELEKHETELQKLDALRAQLATLEVQQLGSASIAGGAESKRATLEVLTKRISSIAVLHDDMDRLAARLNERSEQLSNLIATWGDDEVALPRSKTMRILLDRSRAALSTLKDADKEIGYARHSVQEDKLRLEKTRRTLEQRARTIRHRVEELSHGAGVVAARSHDLQREIALIEGRASFVDSIRKRLGLLRFRRSVALDSLEKSREATFEKRYRLASRLTRRLHPRIVVEVERAGQIEPYAAEISNALRGSGLRHNELSRELAKTVSPRELAEWSESFDVEALMMAAHMSSERSGKVLTAIRHAGIDKLLSLHVDDNVNLLLLDKSSHKSVGDLSTGQRCTVVLPILLERQGGTLIMDQPEDHIDNAFIAETLIKAISDHSRTDQIIVSTHNANIPVLGDASLVVQMASDGRRGFVQIAAPLEDPGAVSAITSIMEGGKRAFRTRAAFYNEAG